MVEKSAVGLLSFSAHFVYGMTRLQSATSLRHSNNHKCRGSGVLVVVREDCDVAVYRSDAQSAQVPVIRLQRETTSCRNAAPSLGSTSDACK